MAQWFVTGASAGIGRAVTEQLLAAGHRVAATARQASRLRDLEQVAVNLTGPIQLVRAALPFLRAQGGGRIIANTTTGAQISSPGGSLYHASKWGIEGFLESVSDEVAPFGIAITMVEPGNVRTGFGAALSLAQATEAYAQTPVGQVRRYIAGPGGNLTGAAPGDPERVAAAIIRSASDSPAPRRLILGTDAYQAVHAALAGRLRAAEASRELAAATDYVLESKK